MMVRHHEFFEGLTAAMDEGLAHLRKGRQEVPRKDFTRAELIEIRERADDMRLHRNMAMSWTRAYARLADSPQLEAEFLKLKGKRLGCWCKPKGCHGDVIVELLED